MKEGLLVYLFPCYGQREQYGSVIKSSDRSGDENPVGRAQSRKLLLTFSTRVVLTTIRNIPLRDVMAHVTLIVTLLTSYLHVPLCWSHSVLVKDAQRDMQTTNWQLRIPLRDVMTHVTLIVTLLTSYLHVPLCWSHSVLPRKDAEYFHFFLSFQ